MKVSQFILTNMPALLHITWNRPGLFVTLYILGLKSDCQTFDPWQRQYLNALRCVREWGASQNRKSPQSRWFEIKGLIGQIKKCCLRPLLENGWVFGALCCSEKIHTLTASAASEWCKVGFRTLGDVCVEYLRGVYKAVSFAKLLGITICRSWIYLHFTGSRGRYLRLWN